MDASDDIFRPVTLRDMPVIKSCLRYAGSRTCDYTVGGIYLWVDYFDYRFCVIDDTLFVRGVAAGMPTFALPVGKMGFGDSLAFLKGYCSRFSLPLHFSSVPQDRLCLFPEDDGWIADRIPGWGDYLYDASSLASLAGNALKKKRNRFNRFVSDNPQFIFEPLTFGIVPELKEAYAWLSPMPVGSPPVARYEREQVLHVLENYMAYPFEGAVLRLGGGRIVAFALGEILGDTLYVHVEKMDHSVAGAGEAVNRLFASMMVRKYGIGYINREDDAGDEGLRRAKMAYSPICVLEKYNVSLG